MIVLVLIIIVYLGWVYGQAMMKLDQNNYCKSGHVWQRHDDSTWHSYLKCKKCGFIPGFSNYKDTDET